MKKASTQSIFKWIMLPMCLVILIETFLLAGMIVRQEITDRLATNERDIISQKVITRKNYIQTEMVSKWSRLEEAAYLINEIVKEAETAGTIRVETLDQGSESCMPVMNEVSAGLIDTIRTRGVNGAYIVFNNEDMKGMEDGIYQDKPGLYIRDLDPVSTASVKNSDLLIMRGPVELVKNLQIATDSSWKPQFEFEEQNEPYYPFLKETYANANRANLGTDVRQAGYWSEVYKLSGDNVEVMSYSVPLRLEDGRIYGVLGIELLADYVKTFLPSEELVDTENGTYMLAVDMDKTGAFKPIVSSGNISPEGLLKDGKLIFPEDSKQGIGESEKKKYFYTVDYLDIYDSNTPFIGQRWGLIGIVEEANILAFSKDVGRRVIFGILGTSMAGILACFFVSFVISHPIRKLAKNLRSQKPGQVIRLPRTQITELNSVEEAIEALSWNIANSSTKFSRILELASVKIGGFELNMSTQALFVTDDFFEIFGKWDMNVHEMDARRFLAELESLEPYKQEAEEYGVEIYRIPIGGKNRYIRLMNTYDGNTRIGLAEDVTKSVREKRKIEHERDHDLLTGLINRRALGRKMNHLFGAGESVIKEAALVMIDLDNLKHINDTYGHEAGDSYISHAAQSFKNGADKNTVVARISGDEFYLFFYGYDTEAEVREWIERLKQAIREGVMQLPDGTTCPIEVSGGIAWYRKDASSYEKLSQYSDFAMYQVKKRNKGEIREFDLELYDKEMRVVQNKAALDEMISKQAVEFYFQPIVDAVTGDIFAYEALMRGNLPGLRNPLTILELAKAGGKLHQIETLTWAKAMEAFVARVNNRSISKQCKIFINSIANAYLNEKDVLKIEESYAEYLDRVVLEVTESDRTEQHAMEQKGEVLKKWGAQTALDDYGSGYNSEVLLLQVNPDYVKIDMSIIRNIHMDTKKQKIVSNLVSYAKETDKRVIAEGVECKEEMDMMIDLGVDYLQGYYLASPDREPPIIGWDVIVQIQKRNQEVKKM